MKLKKIASLMLAGVMAVSMLAGCNNGSDGNSGNNGNNGLPLLVYRCYRSAETADQPKIDFAADAALDRALAAVLPIIRLVG